MKEVGRRWKTLAPQDLSIYEVKAQEDKARYESEMEVFNNKMSNIIN